MSLRRGRQAAKPIRGVFERPSKSGIWWVNYYVDGKRHREKVGTRKAASDLYSKRKNDARVGVKLPDSLKAKKAVLFEELAEDAMEYSKAHKRSHRGDVSNLSSLLPVFGKMKAEEITAQTISAYFGTRADLKPASINRYRSTLSMIFSEGIRNGKVSVKPTSPTSSCTSLMKYTDSSTSLQLRAHCLLLYDNRRVDFSPLAIAHVAMIEQRPG